MELLKKENIEQYKQFIESHPNGHLLQSPEWANVKVDWKWEALIEKNEAGKIIGGLSVLIRKISGMRFSMMYSPRGPVCDYDNLDVLSVLIGGVKMLAEKYNACVYKVDPNVVSDNTQFRLLMGKMGFRLSSRGKTSDGIQKNNVFRLEVLGKTDEELMAQFNPKTRYNIRLAQKHHVEIKIRGVERLDEFMFLMKQTGSRDGFIIRPKEYFKRILDQFNKHARLYMAYYGGEPVAGAIAVQYGDKTWYLYGASSNSHRNTMPNYLLQWEMIKWSLEARCSIYDFRGACGDISNSLYGLYRFKKGFNGDFIELMGEFDLILNKPAYEIFELGMRLRKTLNCFCLNLIGKIPLKILYRNHNPELS
jgi:peptidoglycan pentaglycine glycine transferase (the first glycine)